MKKEINTLLTPSRTSRYLKINSYFNLTAEYLTADGMNVAFAHADEEPTDVRLYLVYSLNYEKFGQSSTEIKARTYEEIIQEVSQAMADMLDKQKETLIKKWTNGCIGGLYE